VAGVSAGMGCRDDNNKPVDWFVVYKMPTMAKSANPNFQRGFGYATLDPSHSSAFQISTLTLDADAGYLGNTLDQVYSGSKSSTGWIMYNDQKPNGNTSTTYGHSKGVLGFDGKSGFWLIHSVPRWPEPHGTAYDFPENERIYGQNFLCVSLSFDQLEAVGYQFLFSRPWLYDSNIPTSMADSLPTLSSIIDGAHQKVSNVSINQFASTGGVPFFHLAKTSKWNNDIYESLVAPFIGDGLYVETWMRPYFESFCPTAYEYPVVNVQDLSLGPDIVFGETNDHSKWAISYSGKKGWVCIGDINHQESQFTRSGGTMCFNVKGVRAAYKAMIQGSNDCGASGPVVKAPAVEFEVVKDAIEVKEVVEVKAAIEIPIM